MSDPESNDPDAIDLEKQEVADAEVDADEDAEVDAGESKVTLVKGGVSSGRRSTNPRLLIGGIVALVVLLLAGAAFGIWYFNRESEPSVQDLVDDKDIGGLGALIDEGWRDLDSVRVNITSPDQPNSDLNVQFDTEGNCTGTFGADGSVAEVRSAGGSLFYLPGPLYWEQVSADPEQIEAVRTAVDGRWIEGGEADNTSVIGEFCLQGISALVPQEYDEAAFVADGWQIGGDAEVDGTPTVTLTMGEQTIFVATEGEPWVLRIELATAAGPSTYTFSDHNAPLEVEAPPTEDIIGEEELRAAVEAALGPAASETPAPEGAETPAVP